MFSQLTLEICKLYPNFKRGKFIHFAAHIVQEQKIKSSNGNPFGI